MQAKTKCSSEAPQSSQSNLHAPAPQEPRGGYRPPGSAFSESFLEKLRLAVRWLDGDKAEEAEAPAEVPTEAEAALAGPRTVERVRTRGGAAWAVVRSAEPVAAGGWARRRALVSHLQLARYFAADPEALALLIESVGPEALPILGRAPARRVEAVLKEGEG